MPKEQRYSTPSPKGLSYSLCPSRGKTVESGPFLGWVVFLQYLSFSYSSSFFFHNVCCFPLCVSATSCHGYSRMLQDWKFECFFRLGCSCDLLVCLRVCAGFAGDGGSRGAGLSHAATGVLGGGVELVGGPVIRESKNPWTHHQTLQIARVSGQRSTSSHLFTVTF